MTNLPRSHRRLLNNPYSWLIYRWWCTLRSYAIYKPRAGTRNLVTVVGIYEYRLSIENDPVCSLRTETHLRPIFRLRTPVDRFWQFEWCNFVCFRIFNPFVVRYNFSAHPNRVDIIDLSNLEREREKVKLDDAVI